MNPGNILKEKRDRIAKIAVVCAGIVFAILLAKTLLTGEKNPGHAAPAAARARPSNPVERTAPAQPPQGEQEATVPGGKPSAADSAECLIPPNPFKPSAALRADLTGVKRPSKAPAKHRAPKRITIKLKGIVTDHTNGERIALLDDRLLRVGDEHKGFTLLEIGVESVVLASDQERRVLKVEKK